MFVLMFHVSIFKQMGSKKEARIYPNVYLLSKLDPDNCEGEKKRALKMLKSIFIHSFLFFFQGIQHLHFLRAFWFF